VKRVLTAGWFVAFAGVLLYLTTTFACFAMTKWSRPAAVERTELNSDSVESWKFKNPELDTMLAELKRERENLATREQQLKELEARLVNERQEIGTITQAVFRLQRDMEQTLARVKQEEIPNLKKLAKVHASMSPDGSANILKEQTDEEVIKVLFYMKPTESGPVLEAFARLGKAEAARAAKLAERLRRTVEAAPTKRS
jgi:flagellar motility protein MotE (MotC chaperone)